MDHSAPAILITTKNRKDELRTAVASCLTQSASVELLIFDDGSTDGTSEMVRTEFPSARVERVEQSLGIIAARNRAIELASNPIVFTIDDDCVFPSPHTVAQTLREFDHPRVGAVAIPCINVRYESQVRQQAPEGDAIFVAATFMGGANALRRDIFTSLGGYRESFWRQGEEGDYALRMLEAGYVVRLGRAAPIHHMESPIRVHSTTMYYMARNNVLFAWHNAPLLYLPLHVAVTSYRSIRAARRKNAGLAAAKGVLAGFWGIARGAKRRRPIAKWAYLLQRRLKKGPLPLTDIEAQLPPVKAMSDGAGGAADRVCAPA